MFLSFSEGYGDFDDDFDSLPSSPALTRKGGFAQDFEKPEPEPEVRRPEPVAAVVVPKRAKDVIPEVSDSIVSSSASLTPQKEAKAAITLTPSPQVTRRSPTKTPQNDDK